MSLSGNKKFSQYILPCNKKEYTHEKVFFVAKRNKQQAIYFIFCLKIQFVSDIRNAASFFIA